MARSGYFGEFVALLGGDDSAGAPVGWIRAALDQAGGFEVIEEVDHDRTVDSESRQAPSEVVGQRVRAVRGVPNLVAVTSDVVHQPPVRARPRSADPKIFCRHDDLSRI
jgi:hypothetical protein